MYTCLALGAGVSGFAARERLNFGVVGVPILLIAVIRWDCHSLLVKYTGMEAGLQQAVLLAARRRAENVWFCAGHKAVCG